MINETMREWSHQRSRWLWLFATQPPPPPTPPPPPPPSPRYMPRMTHTQPQNAKRQSPPTTTSKLNQQKATSSGRAPPTLIKLWLPSVAVVAIAAAFVLAQTLN